MACYSCSKNIMISRVEKPPKCDVSNGWAIGKVPVTVTGDEIEKILATTLAKIRVFSNVYSYTAGAHKSIKGHHTFL